MATAGRRGSSRTSSGSNQLLRSIHEGWAYHFTPESRKWMRRWLVVDGSRLVVFSSDRICAQAVVVSLNLGQGTKVKDIVLQPNVHGLDIELTTLKGVTENRTDFFGFTTPNECDLWKAYILGFSYGIVPENLNLLPGQLKDVREAIIDIGTAPPPLPSPNPKRPSLQNALPGLMIHQRPTQNICSAQEALSPQHSSNALISPYSEIPASKPTPQLIDSTDFGGTFEEGGEADVIEQLERRRKELAMKALEKEIERKPSKHGHHGSPGPMTVRFHVQMQRQSSWNDSQPILMNNKDSVRLATHRVSLQKHRTPLAFTNNNELPPFYDAPEKNKVTPSWYINCDREMAEMILTAARNCGNMFMRPSFNTNPTETYVISFRRDLPGGLELRHYAVYRTNDGFKLDVVDKHSPMSCLSDVMSFFTNYVGPSAKPLNSQDVDSVLGGIVSPGSVISPRPDLSFSQEQLLPMKDSSLENEAKLGENNKPSENRESHRKLTLPLTSADDHLDKSIQLLHINGKNEAAASPVCSAIQEQGSVLMTAADLVPPEVQQLTGLVSGEKVDSSCC